MSDTLITGRIRRYPGHHPMWNQAQRHMADKVLADCEAAGVDPELFSEIDLYADYEDFWEDAVRISAAYRACIDAGISARVSTDWAELTAATADQRRLGPVAIAEQALGHHARDTQLLDPVFLAYAGRAITAVTLNFEGHPHTSAEPDLVEMLYSAAQRGTERMVIKSTTAKAGVWVIELNEDQDRKDIADEILELLGWSAIRAEGLPGQLVLQDYVPMTWEMRHFIVDGELITSAGCIEEFTPFNAVTTSDDGLPTVTKYNDLLREHRGTLGRAGTEEVISRPLRATIMREFAARVGREHGGTIVIDTAINAATGQPLVVEFNDLPNSGLYACDVWSLYRALVVATDRGYGDVSTPPITLYPSSKE